MPFSLPSSSSSSFTQRLQTKRATCRRLSSTYAYDFLGLIEADLVKRWVGDGHLSMEIMGMPEDLFISRELILDEASGELIKLSNSHGDSERRREVGTNQIGMVAWSVLMKTPEYPIEGREVVFVANDVTVQSGSFGMKEDAFFEAVSKYARANKLPRVYIACNSGARIGLVEQLKPLFKVAWKDEADPTLGFDYLYLTDQDYMALPQGTVVATEKQVFREEGEDEEEVRWVLNDIVGLNEVMGGGSGGGDGIGVENLRGSATIAGETARAYNEVFTLSYVTGRSVGIGAYLVRLGQRTIQMEVGPLILTGYNALNKLLGKEVYSSQDQLGGPQVMAPNGVSHLVVQDDSEGVKEIMDWLSFVPKTSLHQHPSSSSSPSSASSYQSDRQGLSSSRMLRDPIDRLVGFCPPKDTAYNVRHMLAGCFTNNDNDNDGNIDNNDNNGSNHRQRQGQGQKQGGGFVSGFFDKGSFKEYMAEWGKGVVVGRARLGGIPMGVIAVETRAVELRVPADPADPSSRQTTQQQAGQVGDTKTTAFLKWIDVCLDIYLGCRDLKRGKMKVDVIFNLASSKWHT
jgi:acetyl-CoA carboxylase/biotin carboxylase 1